MVKNSLAIAGNTRDAGWIPSWKDLLEKGIATHSSILAWGILWTEEPGGLQSMGHGGHKRVGCNSATEQLYTHI